ncbi:hypothetical protein QA641_27380 [Bradyrhizobium sp. CB1650]|uniref:hypothetical protein n=1 Tax=Bradyrhizobium sp. CB1650 TaxID=3039153 RepID=UPI0024347FE5|nr:hypothetical protein [Bradyrhizobium sp. CB1650]WGD49350.1 hypothetical protein QA641_27380 [Bradyrhizobium sp. CB1650]
MNDVMTLAMFAAKVLCLIVFVSVLKPDGSIGAARTSTYPADCTEASGKADMRARVLPIAFASGRQSLHCTPGRRALLK